MTSIRVVRVYPHSPGHVWRALTDRELLARWLMPNDFEPRVGHRFTLRAEPGPGFDGIVRCELTELREPERLAFTWTGGPIDTVVTFDLVPDGANGTRLVMTQTGFRGIKAWLVSRILAAGCRTIYGSRLPAVLDEMRRGGRGEAAEDAECMTRGQGLVRRFLSVLERKKP